MRAASRAASASRRRPQHVPRTTCSRTHVARSSTTGSHSALDPLGASAYGEVDQRRDGKPAEAAADHPEHHSSRSIEAAIAARPLGVRGSRREVGSVAREGQRSRGRGEALGDEAHGRPWLRGNRINRLSRASSRDTLRSSLSKANAPAGPAVTASAGWRNLAVSVAVGDPHARPRASGGPPRSRLSMRE